MLLRLGEKYEEVGADKLFHAFLASTIHSNIQALATSVSGTQTLPLTTLRGPPN